MNPYNARVLPKSHHEMDAEHGASLTTRYGKLVLEPPKQLQVAKRLELPPYKLPPKRLGVQPS